MKNFTTNQHEPTRKKESNRTLSSCGSRLKKQKIIDGLVYCIMAAALAGVIVALLYVLVYIFRSQAGYLNLSFLTSAETGILPMIVTTLYVVIVSIAVALPVGLATAIFLNEYSGNSP
ncbi:MAG: hypothetical protein FWD24_09000, partial [Treponema sp.]|nr:hypothetical protein [Treponema sp.]